MLQPAPFSGPERVSRRYNEQLESVSRLVQIGPAQQIVQPTDAVPSVAGAFQNNAVFTGVGRAAVSLGQQINQQLALCPTDARVQGNFTRLIVKIV